MRKEIPVSRTSITKTRRIHQPKPARVITNKKKLLACLDELDLGKKRMERKEKKCIFPKKE